MEFITSIHGGVKLINDEFAYTKRPKNKPNALGLFPAEVDWLQESGNYKFAG